MIALPLSLSLSLFYLLSPYSVRQDHRLIHSLSVYSKVAEDQTVIWCSEVIEPRPQSKCYICTTPLINILLATPLANILVATPLANILAS